MNTSTAKYIGMGLIFLVVFISGYLLSRAGKPYGALLFNLHKLIALGGAIFLGVTAYNVGKVAPLAAGQITALVVFGILFLLTIAAGGMISALAEGGLSSFSAGLQSAIHTAHKILPYLTVVSLGAAFYLLIGK